MTDKVHEWLRRRQAEGFSPEECEPRAGGEARDRRRPSLFAAPAPLLQNGLVKKRSRVRGAGPRHIVAVGGEPIINRNRGPTSRLTMPLVSRDVYRRPVLPKVTRTELPPHQPGRVVHGDLLSDWHVPEANVATGYYPEDVSRSQNFDPRLVSMETSSSYSAPASSCQPSPRQQQLQPRDEKQPPASHSPRIRSAHSNAPQEGRELAEDVARRVQKAGKFPFEVVTQSFECKLVTLLQGIRIRRAEKQELIRAKAVESQIEEELPPSGGVQAPFQSFFSPAPQRSRLVYADVAGCLSPEEMYQVPMDTMEYESHGVPAVSAASEPLENDSYQGRSEYRVPHYRENLSLPVYGLPPQELQHHPYHVLNSSHQAPPLQFQHAHYPSEFLPLANQLQQFPHQQYPRYQRHHPNHQLLQPLDQLMQRRQPMLQPQPLLYSRPHTVLQQPQAVNMNGEPVYMAPQVENPSYMAPQAIETGFMGAQAPLYEVPQGYRYQPQYM